MANLQFKKGDTVKLKSGGPIMTINSVDLDTPDYVECVWFNEKNQPTYQEFDVAVLRAWNMS